MLDFLERQDRRRLAQLRNQWVERVTPLRDALQVEMSEQEAINALLLDGGCIFLEGDLCSVYEARPDTCRAFYVWHSAEYCGRSDHEMCSPA